MDMHFVIYLSKNSCLKIGRPATLAYLTAQLLLVHFEQTQQRRAGNDRSRCDGCVFIIFSKR